MPAERPWQGASARCHRSLSSLMSADLCRLQAASRGESRDSLLSLAHMTLGGGGVGVDRGRGGAEGDYGRRARAREWGRGRARESGGGGGAGAGADLHGLIKCDMMSKACFDARVSSPSCV